MALPSLTRPGLALPCLAFPSFPETRYLSFGTKQLTQELVPVESGPEKIGSEYLHPLAQLIKGAQVMPILMLMLPLILMAMATLSDP